jgi:hypothetical protein
MAVMVDGRVRLEGAPLELISATRGRIWTKTIDHSDLPAHREKYEIVSTRLFAGRTILHVLSDTDPGNGFTQSEGGLADVYFSTLLEARRAA